jgi:electron transfer flavoprotein alpha subunit
MSGEEILCYSEEGAITADLVRLARSLAPEAGSWVRAVVPPGADPSLSDLLVKAGAHSLHLVTGKWGGDALADAAILGRLVRELRPTLVLVGSTKRGREAVGRLAGALDLPAVTGVTALHLNEGTVLVEREALSGNAVATERISRRPAVVAVLPGTSAPDPPAAPTVDRSEHVAPELPALLERVEVRGKAGGQLEIEKAERIVTIGRGLKKKEDLGLIEALARSLQAEVGCTRPLAAEAGWLSDDHWIGLTGHRVHPKLYLAIGVSGAVQHLVGMRSSRVVVALNKDANAPIFSQADYKIVGDLYQVVPALVKALAS